MEVVDWRFVIGGLGVFTIVAIVPLAYFAIIDYFEIGKNFSDNSDAPPLSPEVGDEYLTKPQLPLAKSFLPGSFLLG